MIQKEEFIRIAIITGVHGLLGRLKIKVTSDLLERFEVENIIYLKIDGQYNKFKITEFINYKKKVGLIRLEGIDDRNKAEKFRGTEIFIEKDNAEKTRDKLGEDSFYHYDLLGCSVYYKGALFGKIVKILEAGAGDVLVISDKNCKEFMIPFVESMVDTKNIFDNKIEIYPVEGLFDL